VPRRFEPSRRQRAGPLGQFVGRFGPLTVNNHMGTDLRARPGSATSLRESPGTQGMAAARLLTADELAARLGVQPSWVSKAARANRIPHVRVGRYRRFRWPDIEAWLESQRSDA
jgi:excisionase family DNA binding protein